MEDRPREFHIKSEKDNYDTIYMWNLNNNTNEPIYKTEMTARHGKQTLVIEAERGVTN